MPILMLGFVDAAEGTAAAAVAIDIAIVEEAGIDIVMEE